MVDIIFFFKKKDSWRVSAEFLVLKTSCLLLWEINLFFGYFLWRSVHRQQWPPRRPHMGKGGGEGGIHHPWGSKTTPLPCDGKMGTYNKKIQGLFYGIPFFGQRRCTMFTVQILKKSLELIRIKKKFFKKHLKKLFFYVNKTKCSPLHPPFTQAMASKSITSPITSPEGIFYPCTHIKKYSPPLWKKPCPCVATTLKDEASGWEARRIRKEYFLVCLAPVAQSVENGEASTRAPGSNPGRTLCENFLSLLG